MKLPPVTNEYRPEIQTELFNQLRKSDDQNMKMDQDNFLTSGSVSLQSANGKWWHITVSNTGDLTTTELTGNRIDSDGRPVIASDNPYYTP